MAMEQPQGQAPAQGQPQEEAAEGEGSSQQQIMQVISTVDEGLGVLNQVLGEAGIPDEAKAALAQVQEQFRGVITAIMGKGQQAPQEQGAPASSPAPMEGGPSGVPMSPSVRA